MPTVDLPKRNEQNFDLVAEQYDLTLTAIEAAFAACATLDSPAFIGTPTTTVPPADDNSTRIPTTSWVQAEIVGLGGGPGVTDGDKGDIVVSGSGSVWTVDTAAVTLAKMQNRNSATLVGRGAGAGAGVPQEITLGTNLSMAGTVLNAATGGGGSGGPYVQQRTATANGNLGVADALGLVKVSGTSIVLTLVASGFTTLNWIDVVNTNVDDGSANKVVTISAGADAINLSGTPSISLAPGDAVRLVKVAASAPMWRTLGPIGFLALAANQYASVNAAGNGQEARTDRVGLVFRAADIGPNATYQLGFWPYPASKIIAVSIRTFAGSCSVQITRAGTAINGFGTAVAQTVTRTTTTSTQAIAENEALAVVVTAASALTGLIISIAAERTAP